MSKRDDQIDRAKALLLDNFQGSPWFSGIGVGRVANGIGLVLSVRRGSRREALKALSDLPVPVEVEIREIGVVRAR